MLQTYTISENGVTLNTGDPVAFNINDISTRCKVIHSAGTPTIEINQPGYYQVNFSSVGYNTGEVVAGTPYSGMYAFQLNNNGIPIANAIASSSSTAVATTENVMFSVIVHVLPSCRVIDNNASLTINYLGQVGTLLNANLTVIKLD